MNTSLNNLVFTNRFTQELPSDTETSNYTRQVYQSCYSLVSPTVNANPELIAYSREMANEIDLTEKDCESEEFLKVFSGNSLLKDMEPFAMCYGGHQFGNWAGQLGDGRAINLGEVKNKEGSMWALQLKGSGITPYSRRGDGLAVLRSSIREFICSEAMYHLGVPTTRALSLMLSGEKVMRDMFYDGNQKYEPGAIVCRTAPSFIRFGNFEIFASRNETAVLKKLVHHTIENHFPHLGEPSDSTYIEWFREICNTTLKMVVDWERVGFVHGVMNTDNMSILGLTIDYGPYGWLEDYNPNWTPNTTDAEGKRYSFKNQPQIALWNLTQLGQALVPLMKDTVPYQEMLNEWSIEYETARYRMLAEKLGLNYFNSESQSAIKPIHDLIDNLIDVLQLVETDMTLFFRLLPELNLKNEFLNTATDQEIIAPILDAYYNPDDLTPDVTKQIMAWILNYGTLVDSEGAGSTERKARMNQVNPKYVFRNYLAQQAIDKAESGDYTGVHELLDVLRKPYDEQPGKEEYAGKRPEWARHKAGCSMLSCSS